MNNEQALNPSKEAYEKPTIELVELEHEGHILGTSGGGYSGGGGYQEWS